MVVGGSLQSCQLFTNGKNLNNNVNTVAISRPDSSGPRAAIGATEHPKILANYGGSYVNVPLEALVTSIVGKLVTHSDEPSQSYRVTILNSPAVNAFALPGGYLYVTRGLLALANDEAELAAVMAHEMSHITSDHGIARSRKAGASVIAGRVVSDVLTNEVAGKIARASSRQKLALFSRNQELQADARGINTLGKAGYDPYAAARFLQSMTRYAAYRSRLRSESGDDDFLNSHPSTPRRVELAKRHARAFGTSGVGKRNRANYLSSINGIMFGDSVEQGFVRGRQFSHKALGITFTVPAGFAIDNKAEAVLASGPNETAIRFDAVSNSSRRQPCRISKQWLGKRIEKSDNFHRINKWTAFCNWPGSHWEMGIRYYSDPVRQQDLPFHCCRTGQCFIDFTYGANGYPIIPSPFTSGTSSTSSVTNPRCRDRSNG